MNDNGRLKYLCDIHKQQGGTIHQFNRKYGCDFLAMNLQEFHDKCLEILKSRVMDYMHKKDGENT